MKDGKDDLVKRIAYLEKEVKLLKEQQAEWLARERIIHESDPFVVKDKRAKQKKKQPVGEEEPIVFGAPKKEFDLEGALSKWLPKVFMFILLLGVLWGLKVAGDYGYITNAVRMIAGYAGTAVLYYFGMKFYEQQNKVFSYTLLGGVTALGILTTFAAHYLYGYFNFYVAFLIGIFFIGTGLWMSKRTKSEVLTLFAAVAGFLLPFLLEGESVTIYGFSIYLLLLFMSLFYIALTEKHKYTFYFTFFLFHLTFLVYLVLVGSFEDRLAIVGTVFIQHFTLLFIYFTKKISRHAFTEALIYTNFVFTLGWIKVLDHSVETWVYGGFALFYIGITVYVFLRNNTLLKGVFSAVAVFAVSAYILSFGYEEWKVTLLLLLINGTVGIWVGLRYETMRTVITGSFIYFFTGLAIFMVLPIPKFMSLEHGIWLVFLASVVLIFNALYRYTPTFLKGHLKQIDTSLIIGQVIVLNYVIRLTTWGLQDRAFSPETVNHIYLLVIMLLLGGSYFLSRWKRMVYVVHASVIEFLLLGLGVLFARLTDSMDPNFIFNVGIELLYVALLTILFIAVMKNRFYIHLEKVKQHFSKVAVGLQTIYFVFLNKWYVQSVYMYNIDWEYMLLIHTFLLFAFSFTSISVGKRFNWKPVKYFGAVLMLLCVAKLFVIDLVAISILIRAILFMIIGVVGLLYSKTLSSFSRKSPPL